MMTRFLSLKLIDTLYADENLTLQDFNIERNLCIIEVKLKFRFISILLQSECCMHPFTKVGDANGLPVGMIKMTILNYDHCNCT